ncbi:unnamed protein product [Medioppia subpectinata]|uniref:Serine protease n=1 Tax=Medioppia subpectinata TaxID=1979941 RepID=A0A7R9KLI9_9ACAR|nr:unnamed protein product [Medioppia subpectinata]CAG2105811.1 unnamed protein product [Medioppia subpectinata]
MKSRDNAGDIREKPFSQTPKGDVVYVEPELDLALVAVSGQLDTNGLELSASADMGQRVVAFGSPDYLHNTIFDGVVFSVDRKHETISRGNWESFTHFMNPNTTNITHTCAIYHGFSGGPVLDMSGRVVGINWGGIIDYHETFAVTSTDVKVQTLSPRIRNLLQKMPKMSDFALNVTEGVVVMSVVFTPNDEHSSPPMAKKPKLSAEF